uniref:histone deacetylase family protein n=1 Tax=Thaumasiovibrio occultus TaxID=1891184 RepID=UPI000B353F86|nr:histone deacetylase [Thaumasiovibrio occultus]
MIPLVYHSIYSELPLPPEHRYPIHKYRLLYQAIVHQQQNNPLWQRGFSFFQPTPLAIDELKQTHHPDYVDALISGSLPAAKMRRIGFPWSECLITRTLTSAGGTCLTAELAIKHEIALHLSGGYHHAHADFGSGFCLFNDLVLAAKRALNQPGIDRVLIIDSDVHHGDGTATLCDGNDDIITLSFHCDKNFPARKPDSDIDIPFPRELDNVSFLSAFESVVSMAVNCYQPDLILYDAGVDIHCDDELGYFNISTEAILQRDRFMLQLAKQKAVPIACVVGGGYRSQHQDLVPIHLQLFHAAMETQSVE